MKFSTLIGKPRPYHPLAIPDPHHLQAAVSRVLKRWPDTVAKPSEKDGERLIAEVRERLETSNWENTPLSLVTSAARALFERERQARLDLELVREFYYEEISASDRSVFLGSMMEVYFSSFDPDAKHTIDLARALTVARQRIGGRWGSLLQHIPECLDPAIAPEVIAEQMIKMDAPWFGLRKLGLISPHAPGMMDYVNRLYLERLRPRLHRRDTIEMLLKWLQPEEGRPSKATDADKAITAFLIPWVDAAPSEEIERLLTERLLALFGDPRIGGESTAWATVPDELRAVFERWLTGENIRFFLDVVTAVEDSHMWEERERFWLSLHDQRRIDAAWVAFSWEGVRYAQQRAGNRTSMRFGRQEAGGTRTNTSLLILKIGSKVVVEGSHSYKVHVFRADNPKAPKLYQPRYDCELIRGIPGAWSTPHLGNWQGRVLERI